MALGPGISVSWWVVTKLGGGLVSECYDGQAVAMSFEDTISY